MTRADLLHTNAQEPTPHSAGRCVELARLGADVVAADISPGQLELNRQRVGGGARGARSRARRRRRH